MLDLIIHLLCFYCAGEGTIRKVSLRQDFLINTTDLNYTIITASCVLS